MIPEHIIGAAGRGEIETIRAYFDDDREGARNVNDTSGELSENDSCMTLLLMCADGGDSDHLTLAHVKRYVREPHREFLALRGLAMRGHLAPMGTRRTRGAQKWKAAVAFLAWHGDNGVVWNVLSFWRATK